jgi:hypothetical protein
VATPLAAGESRAVKTAISIRVTYEPGEASAGVPDEALVVGVLALDTDAHVRATSDRRVAFDLPPGDGVFQFNEVVDLARGQSALRVGVASRTTGRTGTVHLPIDLPDLGDGKLALSGIVLAPIGQDRPPSSGATEMASLLPFAPTVGRTFAAEDTLRVFVRVFPPKDGEDPLQAALTIDREGAAVRASAVQCGPSVLVAGALDCQSDLALSDLPPGSYALTFAARTRDEKPVSRSIPIRVE